MTFGLLIDWVSSTYHQEVWAGIQNRCHEGNINLVTLVTGRPGSPFQWEQMRNQLLEFVDSPRFDGLLLMSATLVNHLKLDQFQVVLDKIHPTPVVSMGVELPGISGVMVDNRSGFSQILSHLYDEHGYRRFAHVGGPETNSDASERRLIFNEFLQEKGLDCPSELILAGDFTSAWGKEAVRRMVPGDRPDFDVLVCANDKIAMGAIEALTEMGIQVPDDVAVTGFDDIPAAGLGALTSARQPLREMGRTAVDILESTVQKHLFSFRRLDSVLVTRQSCGCLSRAAIMAQVQPHPQTPQRFEEWIQGQEDQLAKQMTAEGLPLSVAQDLRELFLRAWTGQDGRLFLAGIRKILDDLIAQNLPTDLLQYPLSILRHSVLVASEPRESRAFLETLIHQSRILLTEVLHTQDIRRETQRELYRDMVSDLNARLVYSRDFHEQAGLIGNLFPPLGIRNFRLSMYADPHHPLSAARMLLSEKGEVHGEGVTYDPRALFAPGWEPTAEPWSYVVEALFDRGSPLGFFLLETQEDPALLPIFDQLSEGVGRALETVRRIQALEDQVNRRTSQLQTALDDLEKKNHALKELALRDEMTGLYNRRGFLTLAEHQLRAHSRKEAHLTLFFGDLDGLKIINDTQGHDAGDQAIRHTAALLSQTFRAEDVVARLGGDEFVILAPGCSPSMASHLARRLDIAFRSISDGRYSISLGWISIDPKSPRPLSDWMKDADEALYREKLAKKTRSPVPKKRAR